MTAGWHEGESQEDRGFELAALLDYVSFGARALRRHVLLALGIAGSIIGASALVLHLFPRSYRVDTTILVQGDSMLGPLATGRPDKETTAKGVGDTVYARRNLISIIIQTNLVERWKLTRTPLHRLKDSLYTTFRQPIADDQLVDALIILLENRLIAWNDDRKVTFEVTWNDPKDAYRIAAAAQQNFLEARQLAETAAITDTIAILESYLSAAREQVEAAVSSARALRPAVRSEPSPPPRSEADARTSMAAGVSAEALRVWGQLEAKQRAVEDLEQLRRRRLAELQAQYTEQKAVYAESHPILVNLRESIEALSLDSPQLAELRREAQELEAEYVAAGGSVQAPAAQAPASTALPPSLILRDLSRDPREEYARLELTNATTKYNALLDRVFNARLALDTSRASFKYRYTIVRPPLPPKIPVRPNVPLLLAAGTFAGLLAGVLAALGLELRKGLVVQPWQIERRVGLPVLGELPASALQADAAPSVAQP